MQLFQFCRLMWATEYNAREAGLENGIDAQTANAMNTLLMAFAALEAPVLESALVVHPQLYNDKQFRRAGIIVRICNFRCLVLVLEPVRMRASIVLKTCVAASDNLQVGADFGRHFPQDC